MKIPTIALVALLAGCNSEPAPEPAPADTMAAAPAAAAPAASDAPAPGDYLAVQADGTEQPFSMMADGTFTATSLAGQPVKGAWVQKDGKTCFTSDPASPDDDCWTNQPIAADGTWTSMSDKGRSVTVKPVAK